MEKKTSLIILINWYDKCSDKTVLIIKIFKIIYITVKQTKPNYIY